MRLPDRCGLGRPSRREEIQVNFRGGGGVGIIGVIVIVVIVLLVFGVIHI